MIFALVNIGILAKLYRAIRDNEFDEIRKVIKVSISVHIIQQFFKLSVGILSNDVADAIIIVVIGTTVYFIWVYYVYQYVMVSVQLKKKGINLPNF